MKCELRHPIPCPNEAITRTCGKWVCQTCKDDLDIGLSVCELGSAYSFLKYFPLARLSDSQAMELHDALEAHALQIQELQVKIRREYVRRAEVA